MYWVSGLEEYKNTCLCFSLELEYRLDICWATTVAYIQVYGCA
jgi:hypothetical protein